jgi:hypothetical protein
MLHTWNTPVKLLVTSHSCGFPFIVISYTWKHSSRSNYTSNLIPVKLSCLITPRQNSSFPLLGTTVYFYLIAPPLWSMYLLKYGSCNSFNLWLILRFQTCCLSGWTWFFVCEYDVLSFFNLLVQSLSQEASCLNPLRTFDHNHFFNF